MKKFIRERRLGLLPRNSVEHYQNFMEPFTLSFNLQTSLTKMELKILAFMGYASPNICFPRQEILDWFYGIHTPEAINKGIKGLTDKKVINEQKNTLIINAEFIDWKVY